MQTEKEPVEGAAQEFAVVVVVVVVELQVAVVVAVVAEVAKLVVAPGQKMPQVKVSPFVMPARSNLQHRTQLDLVQLIEVA